MQVSPELVEIPESGRARFEVAAAVRRGDHGRVPGAVGHRDEGGAGPGRRARGGRGEAAFREADAEPRRLRRLSERRGASNSMAANDPPSLRKALGFYDQAVALDPGFAQAWARVSDANSLLYANSTPDARAGGACPAGGRRRPSRSRQTARRGTWPSATTNGWFPRTHHRALEQYEKGLRVAPGDASLLRGTALAEQGLGRWDAAVEHFRQAERLDPRSAGISRVLGDALVRSAALSRGAGGSRPWSRPRARQPRL